MASNMLYKLFRDASDPVLAIDKTGGICFWNDSCQSQLGLSFEQVQGKKCYEVMAGRNLHGAPYCDSECKIFESILSGRHVDNYDLLVNDLDGRDLMVNVGVYLTPQTYRKNSEAAAFLVLRRVDCYRLMQRLVNEKVLTWGSAGQPVRYNLSSRELSILRKLSAGMKIDDIATELFISKDTVRNHTKSIYRKMGVHSRTEAVSLAMRLHIS